MWLECAATSPLSCHKRFLLLHLCSSKHLNIEALRHLRGVLWSGLAEGVEDSQAEVPEVAETEGPPQDSAEVVVAGSCVKRSRSQAQGSTWFALALATRLKSTAARRPPSMLPTKSQMV